MRLALRILIGVSFLCLMAGVALAVPIVSVDTDSAIVIGNTLTVDIVIEDVVAPGLNAFELDLMFDPTILDPTSVVSGGFLLAPVFTVQMVLGVLEVEFAEVTLLPLGAGGGGILATIVFDTIGVGTSPLDLNDVILSEPFGVEITPVTLANGSVVVTPEPGTWLLMGSGLVGLAGLAWRRRKQEQA